MPICNKCSVPFAFHIVIDGCRRNLKNRKYCLECSPFGRHNTRTLHNDPVLPGTCRLCGAALVTTRRRRCEACDTLIRRYRTKLAAIVYLGGCCKRCGWKGHPAAFQFHHPGAKGFTIGGVANKSWDVIKRELNRCELLCANCHQIEHSSRRFDPRVIAEAKRYRGRLLDVTKLVELLDTLIAHHH